jgi:hypothetical protein
MSRTCQLRTTSAVSLACPAPVVCLRGAIAAGGFADGGAALCLCIRLAAKTTGAYTATETTLHASLFSWSWSSISSFEQSTTSFERCGAAHVHSESAHDSAGVVSVSLSRSPLFHSSARASDAASFFAQRRRSRSPSFASSSSNNRAEGSSSSNATSLLAAVHDPAGYLVRLQDPGYDRADDPAGYLVRLRVTGLFAALLMPRNNVSSAAAPGALSIEPTQQGARSSVLLQGDGLRLAADDGTLPHVAIPPAATIHHAFSSPVRESGGFSHPLALLCHVKSCPLLPPIILPPIAALGPLLLPPTAESHVCFETSGGRAAMPFSFNLYRDQIPAHLKPNHTLDGPAAFAEQGLPLTLPPWPATIRPEVVRLEAASGTITVMFWQQQSVVHSDTAPNSSRFNGAVAAVIMEAGALTAPVVVVTDAVATNTATASVLLAIVVLLVVVISAGRAVLLSSCRRAFAPATPAKVKDVPSERVVTILPLAGPPIAYINEHTGGSVVSAAVELTSSPAAHSSVLSHMQGASGYGFTHLACVLLLRLILFFDPPCACQISFKQCLQKQLLQACLGV